MTNATTVQAAVVNAGRRAGEAFVGCGRNYDGPCGAAMCLVSDAEHMAEPEAAADCLDQANAWDKAAAAWVDAARRLDYGLAYRLRRAICRTAINACLDAADALRAFGH